MPLGVEELRTQAVVPDAVARHDGGNVHLPVESEFVIAVLEPARERLESAVHGGDAEVTRNFPQGSCALSRAKPRIRGSTVNG